MKRLARLALLWIALLSQGMGQAAEPAARPNLILILADDFGYECVGANGGASYKTPVLDQLAAGGMRFQHCYAQPLCTPTRVQLMTGIYNVRNYVDFGHIDPQATTFAQLLKRSGYATGIAGKWQLGRDRDLPQKFGFDESCLWQHTRRPSRYKNPGLEIDGKEVDYTHGEYGPDIVNDWAIKFIERHKSGPFLLYYPMMLTHEPFEPTPDSTDYDDGPAVKARQNNKAPGENTRFGGMVSYMDKLIGKLVARLDELDLRRNTLLVFVGDNGTGKGVRSRLGEEVVVGGKGSLTRDGMHVPLIVNWQGKVAAGQVSQDLVDSTDFLPTLCAAAGCEVPAALRVDGRSFLPQLLGEAGQPRDWYYCWYSPRGVFQGEFAANRSHKLYRDGNFFDVAADPQEKRPLETSSLPAAAAASHKSLQEALRVYEHARPKHLEKK